MTAVYVNAQKAAERLLYRNIQHFRDHIMIQMSGVKKKPGGYLIPQRDRS